MEEEDFYHDNSLDWAKEAINYSARKICRRSHYKILHKDALKQLRQNNISTVSAVLAVSTDVACTLLLRNNWSLSSACDEWFADGVETNPIPPAERSESVVVCKICYEETSPQNTISTACGHPFCTDCWKTYVATAINDGAGCITLMCPDPGCKAAVGVDIVDSLTTAEEREKYYTYLNRSYVERSQKRKWCPSPGCEFAVEFDAFASDSYDVVCECSHRFCWRCGEENHGPVDCKTAEEWLGKYASVTAEAFNAKWISKNTKRCKKCSRRIHKIEGCNQMTCPAPCGFEFCWGCMRPWNDHTGNIYKCNKEAEAEVEVEVEADHSMNEHNYHYYEKWELSEKWGRLALAGLKRSARGENAVVEDAQLQLVMMEAWEQLVEGWCVLKWCYVVGFFLALDEENNIEKMRKWGFLQEKVEVALRSLHNCVIVTKNISRDGNSSRLNLIHLTSFTRKYLENLVAPLMMEIN